ncbi:MAG: hypothetical protein KGO94_10455 [Alphaproteobacteria bacterium]|nr:hypothetical protein [Alphaproteobacteria bacterium]
MKSVLKVALAAALVSSSVLAVATPASAHEKRRHQDCMAKEDMAGVIVLGAVLGAVTGGVGSAVAYGAAYAVGGAAIGGGAGALLGAAHSGHNRCY